MIFLSIFYRQNKKFIDKIVYICIVQYPVSTGLCKYIKSYNSPDYDTLCLYFSMELSPNISRKYSSQKPLNFFLTYLMVFEKEDPFGCFDLKCMLSYEHMKIHSNLSVFS